MGKLYDGKLTAWLWGEADKIIQPILPAIDKFYEGKTEFEIQTLNPKHNQVWQQIIDLARKYSEMQSSGKFEIPSEVSGEVDHGEA